MKSFLIPIGLTCLCVSLGHAADVYTPVPLTVGSFSADVVVEKTAAPPIENYVTAGLDGGTNLTGNAWIETGFYPTRPSWGLPAHGTTFSAQYNPDGTLGPDTNHVYKMAPDYTVNNALFLSRNNGPAAASLGIANPAVYQGLSIVNCSGNGGETIGYMVHHADLTTETGTFVSADWFHGNGSAPFPAWMTHCLLSCDGGNLQQIDGGNGDLYYNDITVSAASPVVSIDFTNAGGGGGGRMGLFAISGSTDGVAYTNALVLTGFNADLIVEATAPNFSMNVTTCTATMERGTNLWGKVYMEKGFGGQNASWGLPPAGSTFTTPDSSHSFTLAPNYTLPNAMLVAGPGYGPNGGTFTLTTPTAYNALSLLGGATWGPKYVDVTVHHTDGSSEFFSNVGVEDWWHSGNRANNGFPNTLALMTEAGFEVDNLGFDIGVANRYELYAIDIVLGNTTSPVTKVDFALSPDTNNGGLNPIGSPSYVVFILGLGGSTGATTPAFMPALVTGYNADMVVEKAAVARPHGLYNATTVSMDGGTNNTGNTWYEKGYYKQFPATGLPAAGSTVHSIAQANSYVMPSSYTANNAAFIDASHTNANLTPVTPAAFTALSFLSSDANGWVSNRVVMQYLDGTSDTNYFVSQDWFNVTPYAFSPLGRVNLDSPAINNDPGHSGTPNPRLYEAQVGLNNTTSPLTNVALTFLSGSGGSSRMVVMAVSAATTQYPVIFRGITQSTNTTIEGVAFTLTAATAGGAQPITNNWQVQSNNVWVNLTDGVAGVSGSSTLTATIATYPGWMTNAGSPINGACNFRLQAANPAATVVSSTATVTLRSGYLDLPNAGDAITAFGGAVGDAGAPGNIDHLVGGNPEVKCLWHSPTANPVNVGFVVTPSVGSSIARGIRLYTANDGTDRDPTSVMVEGSSDGGNTWFTVFAQTTVALSATRNSAASVAPNPFTQAMQELDFYTNNAPCTTYRVTFPTVTTPASALVQIGEVELLGISLNTTRPFFVVQPPAAQKVFVGASPTFVVVAGGAPTLLYQWYSNNVAVAGARASSFKVSNVQLGNSGNQFYCQVQNINGSTNSTTDVLNVIAAPTEAYPAAVLGDHPMAFYRLDETPDDGAGNNTTIANDYVGGFFGTYSNAVIGMPGYNPTRDSDTAATFGGLAIADSMIPDIGLNFAAPAPSNVAFSVEAWVQGSAVQTADNGIATIGYGGFEQFNLDTGGSAGGTDVHNFRFYVRDAAGNIHGPSGTVSPQDLRWHHLVGVCDEAHSNVVLYVDGMQNAIDKGFSSGLGILAPTTPLSIGARRQNTTTDYNFQFLGTIDEVAFYNAALTPAQVLAHYYAANPPPVFTVQPTNTIADELSTLTLYSSAYGPGTMSYQWYQSTNGVDWDASSGQTRSNFVINSISAAYNNYYFYVVATNAFGSVTSSVSGQPGALLNVISGPPQLQADVPYSQLVVAGSTISIEARFAGTAPITYQWQTTPDGGATWNSLSNGGRISGATSNVLTVSDAQMSDALGYRLSAFNTPGGNASSVDAVTVLPYVGFNTNGLGWQMQGTVPPSIVNGALVITDGGASENGSAYSTNRVYVAAPFRAWFTYTATGIQGNMADGACFIIHNDSRGSSVLSGGGGTFGISGVSPSIEFELNLYPGANGGTGIAFNVNGNNGNIPSPANPTGAYLSTAPVVLDSGVPIDVVITYYGAGLIQADLTQGSATKSFSINTESFPGGADLPTLVGAKDNGGLAWVGFAGADGGSVSFQKISNFAMISLPALSVRQVGANTVTISWTPQAIGNYVLQSKANLASGVWQNVTAPLSGPNQVTITPLTSDQFFRLVLVQ